MAHQLEHDRSMMYVGETPWHRLGVRLSAPPTTMEAMLAASMDWEVGLKPLVTCDGEAVSHNACYRKTDGRIFGVVGPSWHPIQNVDAFRWFDPFLAAGEATIETAGSLFGGARVWVLARLQRDPCTIVKGDDVLKYILLANAHDGKLAARVGLTPIRVVCNNTLSVALHGGESLIRVRHTKNAADMLVAVRETMNAVNARFEATAEQFRFLASVECTGDDLKRYVNTVLKRPTKEKTKAARATSSAPASEADGASLVDAILDENYGAGRAELASLEEIADNTEKICAARSIDIISENFENATNSLPGVKGTYWGAYNAVTEFLTHQRGRSEWTRLAAQFNDAATLNQRALSTAVAFAKAV